MRALAVALVLAFLVAGCFGGGKRGDKGDDSSTSGTPSPDPSMTAGPGGGPGGNGPGTGAAGPTGTLGNGTSGNATLPTLSLRDCRNLGGVFPVPMASARAALPAGFEPVASPNDPAGGATLYVLWLQCATAVVSTASGSRDAGSAELLYAELAVVPPEGLRVGSLQDCTVPIAFWSLNEQVAAVLQEYRLGLSGDATSGNTVTTSTPAGDIESHTMGAASATITVTGQALATPPQGLGSGDFVLYGVQEGALVSTLIGSAAGGEAVDAAVAIQSEGIPLLEEARAAARGFSVSGFDLTFRPGPLPAAGTAPGP